jgi:hypothetical protein
VKSFLSLLVKRPSTELCSSLWPRTSTWSSCSLPGSEWLPVRTSLPQQCACPQSTCGILVTPEVHGCWQMVQSLGLSNADQCLFSSRINDHFLVI